MFRRQLFHQLKVTLTAIPVFFIIFSKLRFNGLNAETDRLFDFMAQDIHLLHDQ